jgi:hypothetical protein
MSLVIQKDKNTFTFFNIDNIQEYYRKKCDILILKDNNLIKLDKNLDKSKTIVKLYDNILDLKNIDNLYGLLFGFMLNDYIILYGKSFGGLGICVYTDFYESYDEMFLLDEEMNENYSIKKNLLTISYKYLKIEILKMKINMKIVYSNEKFLFVKYIKNKPRQFYLDMDKKFLFLNDFF